MDMAVDRDAAWKRPKASDMGEEADMDVHGITPGLEQDGIARIGEMRPLLLPEHGIEPALDRRRRHGWIEDQNVWSQIGIASPHGMRRARAGTGHPSDRGNTRGGQPDQHQAPLRPKRLLRLIHKLPPPTPCPMTFRHFGTASNRWLAGGPNLSKLPFPLNC